MPALSRRAMILMAMGALGSALTACGSKASDKAPTSESSTQPATTSSVSQATTTNATSSKGFQAGAPSRIWIRPDDYHVPYAGTAGDGRRFFVSEELFSWHDVTSTSSSSLPDSTSLREPVAFIATFWWKADGSFDDVTVDKLARDTNLPPGQAGPAADGAGVMRRHMAALGKHTLEPINVQPFLHRVHGVEFGWRYQVCEGTPSINIEPGNFICYYEPWDGYEYDT